MTDYTNNENCDSYNNFFNYTSKTFPRKISRARSSKRPRLTYTDHLTCKAKILASKILRGK
jgi:hypothetical protein